MNVDAMKNREVEISTGTDGVEKAVALLGVRVQSRVTGLVEKTTLTQSFRNDEADAIEVTYTFPLPPDAAVCGFEIITGERVLTGKIKDRDTAVEEYDSAITEGDGAYLLESHRSDVFTVNVGNINPEQVAVLRIDYVRTLSLADQQLALYFPTTVPPRYVTGAGTADSHAARIDGEMINPLRGASVPYGLSLELIIDGVLAVSRVESPSHKLSVLPDAGADGRVATRVSLADGQVALDRDVVLEVSLAASDKPLSVVETLQGEQYAAVSFLPDFSSLDIKTSAPSHVVFVVDCSGSMGGQSIAQAKRALDLCLRSLKAGDTFNIVRFGSRYEKFSNALVQYDVHSLQRALKWVSETDARLGGTELFGPMQQVFEWQQPGSVVDVVLLTDGQVSNERAVVDLARDHASSHRVFSFGIGAAAGRSLCNGISESTQGAAEYIANDEAIETKVLRTFCRLASPALTDVALTGAAGQRLKLATNKLPALFDGDAVCLLTLVQGNVGESGSNWQLSANHNGEPIEWAVPVPPPVSVQGLRESCIAVSWAHERIQSLESLAGDYAGVYRGANAGRSLGRNSGRNAERARKQILALSTKFNVLCDLTAFVALEHRSIDERNEGLPAQREVPVLMPDGYGMDDALREPLCSLAFSNHEIDSLKVFKSRIPVVDSPKQFESMEFLESPAMLRRSSSESVAPKKRRKGKLAAFIDAVVPGKDEDKLLLLLQLQQGDGSYQGVDTNIDYGAKVETFGKFKEELTAYGALDELGLGQVDLASAYETLYVLHVLLQQYNTQRSLWKRSASKARAYLGILKIDEQTIDSVVRGPEVLTGA